MDETIQQEPEPDKKHHGGYSGYKPYSPLSRREKRRMVEHCIVLLSWADRTHGKEASITIIANETNIPRMSIHWILKDYEKRREWSTLARAARSFGFDYKVFKAWNTADKYKRKKKIIDAVKIRDPGHAKDY